MKSLKMNNPPHPGFMVRVDCLDPYGLTVTACAEKLGVTRQTLNNLVNEKSNISLDMAIRLSKAFGSTPEGWMKLQLQYDLAQVEGRAKKIKVKLIKSQLQPV